MFAFLCDVCNGFFEKCEFDVKSQACVRSARVVDSPDQGKDSKDEARSTKIVFLLVQSIEHCSTYLHEDGRGRQHVHGQ